MARPLEQAVAAIVCTFQEYVGRCGDKHKLCQAELKELIQKELPTWTPTEFRECDYNKFMSVLDTNKDCEVDFEEYVRSLACLCTYCHDYFKDCPQSLPALSSLCSSGQGWPAGRHLLGPAPSLP